MPRLNPPECYLCEKPITDGDITSLDHCPPKNLFPTDGNNFDDLLTINVHKCCNESYSMDEQYFYDELIAFAASTPGGSSSPVSNMMYANFWSNVHNGKVGEPDKKKSSRLRRARSKVNEWSKTTFHDHTGKLIRPKKRDTPRLNRATWKIIRGLYLFTYKHILPSDGIAGFSYFIGERHDQGFSMLNPDICKEHGKYPSVFSYQYPDRNLMEDKGLYMEFWNLNIWGKFGIAVLFPKKGGVILYEAPDIQQQLKILSTLCLHD